MVVPLIGLDSIPIVPFKATLGDVTAHPTAVISCRLVLLALSALGFAV